MSVVMTIVMSVAMPWPVSVVTIAIAAVAMVKPMTVAPMMASLLVTKVMVVAMPRRVVAVAAVFTLHVVPVVAVVVDFHTRDMIVMPAVFAVG